MARLDIRIAGRLRFSKYVDDESLSFSGSGGDVSLSAAVSADQTPPQPPARVRPARPVTPPVTPPPVEVTAGGGTEVPAGGGTEVTEVVTEVTDSGTGTEVTEVVTEGGEFTGGTVDLETGEVTDTEGGVVGTVDLETGEVTDTEGEVLGNVDLEAGSGLIDVVDGAGEVVGVVEVPETVEGGEEGFGEAESE